MKRQLDVRLTFDEERTDSTDAELSWEDEELHELFANSLARTAVVLRNDGFGNLLPDPATELERVE